MPPIVRATAKPNATHPPNRTERDDDHCEQDQPDGRHDCRGSGGLDLALGGRWPLWGRQIFARVPHQTSSYPPQGVAAAYARRRSRN